jgi:hypothetical protein
MINGQCIVEKTCRVCNSNALGRILDLGRQPLANSLLSTKDLERGVVTYPLTLIRCQDCGCVQLRETISPELLFSTYLYFSSYSDAMVSSARDLSDKMIERYFLQERDLIVEIGSNDGYLLQFYHNKGIPVLGVEPAKNIGQVAVNDRGIPTVVDFFSLNLAKQIKQRHGEAKIIHANNVLAHVAGLHDLLEGMRELLSSLGVVVVEVSYVRDMILKACFDMIYHEHLFFHSLDSLERLFKMHQLEVFDVEHIPSHGGSLRVHGAHLGSQAHTKRLMEFRDKERNSGVCGIDFYLRFAARIKKVKRRLVSTLKDVKGEGSTIAAYGAPAKATVLMNYFGIGPELLDYIVDRNPHKQGLFLPGPNLPIHQPDKIRQTNPDYLLILPWNLKEEIMDQMRYIREWGGRFIIPLPEVKIIP